MRQLIVQISIVLVVLVVGFLALFKREAVMSLFRQGLTSAKGYNPAESPQQAVDGFRKAIQNRDYAEAADIYLIGDYAEQMRKAAVGAQALGNQIDKTLHQLEVNGYDSDKIKLVLLLLDPFPKEFEVPNIKTKDDKAAARFVEKEPNVKLKDDTSWTQAEFDKSIMRALVPGRIPNAGIRGLMGINADIPMQKEKNSWRINFVVTPGVRTGVDELTKKYKTYVKLLESFQQTVRNEKMPKHDLEDKFKSEMERAAKD